VCRNDVISWSSWFLRRSFARVNVVLMLSVATARCSFVICGCVIWELNCVSSSWRSEIVCGVMPYGASSVARSEAVSCTLVARSRRRLSAALTSSDFVKFIWLRSSRSFMTTEYGMSWSMIVSDVLMMDVMVLFFASVVPVLSLSCMA